MLRASAKLSFREILFFVVLPSKFMFKPAEFASDCTVSASITPTFVMLPSLTLMFPAVSVPATVAVPETCRFSPALRSSAVCNSWDAETLRTTTRLALNPPIF